ncbi:crossover junction endonuclease EME1-like isoform X2 [Limulus polyphemus]|uniref:Crossover junction endonuclease EME1-like isoform X2 n=1 Tax=Limulus polyphemus TaxID=6850 RepID=A0ABM1TH73_LIMPO|nr:crossover junction endonuclease EME1-like isoform X2 [Limulus polyphemus]
MSQDCSDTEINSEATESGSEDSLPSLAERLKQRSEAQKQPIQECICLSDEESPQKEKYSAFEAKESSSLPHRCETEIHKPVFINESAQTFTRLKPTIENSITKGYAESKTQVITYHEDSLSGLGVTSGLSSLVDIGAKEDHQLREGRQVLIDLSISSDEEEETNIQNCEKRHMPGLVLGKSAAHSLSNSCMSDVELPDVGISFPASKNCMSVSQPQLCREQKQKQRELRKFEKEKEKLCREVEREIRKSSKPGESIKFVRAVVDKKLLEIPGAGDFLNTLQTADVRYSLEDQAVPSSITWFRDLTEHAVVGNEVLKTTHGELQDQLLLVLRFKNFVKMIQAFKQNQYGGPSSDESSLVNYIQKVQIMLPNAIITMVIIGLETYFRDLKKQPRSYQASALGDNESLRTKQQKLGDGVPITRLQVEEALVDLQLRFQISFHLVETMSDIGGIVAKMTKAIAEAPYKKERNQQNGFAWFAQADSIGTVKVEKNGDGLLKLWQQQIQQFLNVSSEVAQAIVAQYRSPRLLLEAYKKCSSEKQAQTLLQDILVRRGVGALERSRRVGPELSRKIHLVFTTKNPEAILKHT